MSTNIDLSTLIIILRAFDEFNYQTLSDILAGKDLNEAKWPTLNSLREFLEVLVYVLKDANTENLVDEIETIADKLYDLVITKIEKEEEKDREKDGVNIFIGLKRKLVDLMIQKDYVIIDDEGGELTERSSAFMRLYLDKINDLEDWEDFFGLKWVPLSRPRTLKNKYELVDIKHGSLSKMNLGRGSII